LTLSTEGRRSTLADHFQTLDWLMDEIQQVKIKSEELHNKANTKHVRRTDKEKEAEEFALLAAAAEVSWRKVEFKVV
jgi:hypothetical protein